MDKSAFELAHLINLRQNYLGGKKLFLNMFTSSIYYIGTGGLFISSTKAVQICTRSIGREVGSFITYHAHSQQDYLSSIRGTVEVTDWWLHNMTPKSDYPKVPNTFISTHLSVLLQVHLEGFNVVLKPQRGHGPQQVVAVDGLPLLPLALVTRSAKSRPKTWTWTSQHKTATQATQSPKRHSKFATNSAAAEALTR